MFEWKTPEPERPVLDAAYLARLGGHVGVTVLTELLADGLIELTDRLDLLRDHAARGEVEAIVYGGIASRGGSISAEHGIGLEKRDKLHYSRGPAELALMRALKRTLDPNGILNPGKVLP